MPAIPTKRTEVTFKDMLTDALESLGEKNGSSLNSVIKLIEDKYRGQVEHHTDAKIRQLIKQAVKSGVQNKTIICENLAGRIKLVSDTKATAATKRQKAVALSTSKKGAATEKSKKPTKAAKTAVKSKAIKSKVDQTISKRKAGMTNSRLNSVSSTNSGAVGKKNAVKKTAITERKSSIKSNVKSAATKAKSQKTAAPVRKGSRSSSRSQQK